ncbi:10047_t:CDS:2 [Acaulospora colombiana]|uniref:10047_t:CDS:1 n=1 Tax=Acaulospora colombiana TaxID=27376 RepID=A0ACA9Q0D1_9GLOM|nr:10047_t:CDS:2 [Acaulospora colombiana]
MAPNKPFITWKEFKEDIKAASIEVIGSIQSAKLSVVATQGAQVAEFGPHSLDHNVYISASAGVSLLASAWMFYRITGGLFNPAVSLALRLIGQITTVRLGLYLIAQVCSVTYRKKLQLTFTAPKLTGAIIASALIRGLTPEPFLIMNKLGEKINVVQGLFIEMFCTSILMLAILMLAAEKSRLTPMAPIGISMTLFGCHMFDVSFTGASLERLARR